MRDALDRAYERLAASNEAAKPLRESRWQVGALVSLLLGMDVEERRRLLQKRDGLDYHVDHESVDEKANAEFLAKVAEDEKADRWEIVVHNGDIVRMTRTECEQAIDEGSGRLATEDEMDDHELRERLLTALRNNDAPKGQHEPSSPPSAGVGV